MQYAHERRPPVNEVNASYRQLRRDRAAREARWQVEPERQGLHGWWLNLTAPPPVPPDASIQARERQRKAELSGYVTFAVLLLGIMMIPNGLQNRPTLLFLFVILAAGVTAAALNRSGYNVTAAAILVSALFVSVGGAMVASPFLNLVWMPALDFFAVPVFLAGLLISRRAPFVAAAFGVGAVVALVALKPRDAAFAQTVHQLGAFHFMVWPILLEIIMAFAAWLWARSVEQAIARADRAEEVAAIEHVVAERKRQLDRGIQDLLETHVRVANGDFSVRAHASQDNLLWQIALSFNNLLARLAKLAQVDQRLQQTEREIDRLSLALENARAGRGVVWPVPSGTRVDRLLRVMAASVSVTGRAAPPAVAAPDASGLLRPTGSAAASEPPWVTASSQASIAPPPPPPAWPASQTRASAGQWRPSPGAQALLDGYSALSRQNRTGGFGGQTDQAAGQRHAGRNGRAAPFVLHRTGGLGVQPPTRASGRDRPSVPPVQPGAADPASDWFAQLFPFAHTPAPGHRFAASEEAERASTPPDPYTALRHTPPEPPRWPHEPLPPLPPSPWPSSQTSEAALHGSTPRNDPPAWPTTGHSTHSNGERAAAAWEGQPDEPQSGYSAEAARPTEKPTDQQGDGGDHGPGASSAEATEERAAHPAEELPDWPAF